MDNKTETRQQREDPGFNTIFDDVFRTIAQKMPYLLIPLINEVFGTEYGEDQEFTQLRNEHYEKFGKVITDSIIQIGGHFYHIECQSEKDGGITVWMMEYDFAIAVEHMARSEDGIVEIEFPESCVLYIRNHRNMPDYHKARVRFPDGQTVVYKIPIIMAQDYTASRIFEKHLLLLLPFHILRYEHFLKTKGKNKKKIQQLLADYTEINQMLARYSDEQERSQLYVDMIRLIHDIADHVIPGDNPIRERLGDVMGGRILTLRSEELLQEGLTKGRTEGRTEGRIEEKRNIAGRMQEAGMPIGQIAAFVNESVDGVLSLLASAGEPVK